MHNIKIRPYSVFFFLFFLLIQLLPAGEDFSVKLQSFQQERLEINRTAMLVLGSWAAGNIMVGAHGNFKSGGGRRSIFTSSMPCGMLSTSVSQQRDIFLRCIRIR